MCAPTSVQRRRLKPFQKQTCYGNQQPKISLQVHFARVSTPCAAKSSPPSELRTQSIIL